MRLVHLSDLHAGFRQFTRLNAKGINQREADVARSLASAIDATIAMAPDLVVIGGDVFHHARPSNMAIDHTFGQFGRLRLALPHTEIVMAAGNHDSPKSADLGSPLNIFRHLGIHVVNGAAQHLDFPALDCSVLAVPDNHHARPELAPTGTRRFNVLLLHGEAGGIGPTKELRARELTDEELHADAWDYAALGHYHVYRQVSARAWYSGATDYTTSNIWGERAEEIEKGVGGKGIVERDLSTGEQTFHALPPTRCIADLTPIDAAGMAVDTLNAAIRDALESVDVDGAVLRLKVTGLPRQNRVVRSMLDRRMLRDYERRALNLQIDFRAEAAKERSFGSTFRRRVPLPQLLEEFLADPLRTLPDDVDRGALQTAAADYLDRAGEVAAVIRAEELTAHQEVAVAA